MGQVEHATDIEAPIDLVFSALTDPRRGSEWNPNIIEVTEVSDAVVRKGTTWRQKALVIGRREDFVCRVAEYDPPRSGVLEISGPHHAKITTRCEPRGGVTRVLQKMEFKVPGGILGRLAAGFVGERLKRELTQTMERQRLTLEKEVKDGSGTA
jgi:uncharacterized protein YndB with AHSA1/START domain